MKRVLAVAALVATLALTGCAGHGRLRNAPPAGGTTTSTTTGTGSASGTGSTAGTGTTADTSADLQSIDTQLNQIDSLMASVDTDINQADKAADNDN